jgi:acyl carrier protein/dTDP-4-dehydrorhamnose reductase
MGTTLESVPHRRLLRTGDLGFVFDNLLFVIGRKDDLIVFNGLNYYPDDLESASSSARPETKGLKAAAFSVEANDGAHLILMQERRHRKKDCVDDNVIAAAIRKVVYQRCNVVLHNIILVPPGKLPTTSSGKIRRRRCRELYQLNQFPPNWTVMRWSGAAKNAGSQAGTNPTAGLRLEALLAMMSEVLECPIGQIDTRLPITAYPFDSIKLVDLMLLAEARFGWNLSVEQLISASSIKALADDWNESGPLDPGQLWGDASLAASVQPQPGPWVTDGDIVLTGATGLLGSRLVAELVKRSDRAIKCLVRHPKANALSRLKAQLRNLGVSTASFRHRVECLEADLSDPALGLTEKQYTSLANSAAILINCAAVLDFVRPYMALRPINVEGARAMINLLAAGRPKRLFQVSSISVLETPLKASQALGEQEPLDYPETLATGYSQSKWVADVMVSHARTRGFDASIIRLPWLIDRPALDDGRMAFFCG